MKLLRYNSNREVSGPIILIIGPDTSPCIANYKQLFFKICDTRIFGGGKKFICSCTFWGQQTLRCLTKSTAHFLIFMDRVYIYIFIWFFMQQTKGYFFGMVQTLSCWTFWPWFQPNRAFFGINGLILSPPCHYYTQVPTPTNPKLRIFINGKEYEYNNQ